jgi:hypothetical protein
MRPGDLMAYHSRAFESHSAAPASSSRPSQRWRQSRGRALIGSTTKHDGYRHLVRKGVLTTVLEQYVDLKNRRPCDAALAA